jgi:TatD DNase family protein
MVIETDSPFLPPEPHRKKRNEPAFIVHTAQKIASLQGKPLEKVWEKTAHNAREFFQLAPSSDKA